MTELGKILLGLGLVMVILGAVLLLAGSLSGKVPWIGRLPGDIYIERGNCASTSPSRRRSWCRSCSRSSSRCSAALTVIVRG